MTLTLTMKDSVSLAINPTVRDEGWSQRLWRYLVFRRLRGLCYGRLTVIDADGRYEFGHDDSALPLHVTVEVSDRRLYRRLASRGSIGVGESYMHGEWQCADLTAMVRLFVRNRAVMDSLEQGVVRLAMLLFRLGHNLRRNNQRNSQTNIAAHYDLGNDFYRLFLDQTMMYSSAIFPHPDSSLEQASRTKLDRICQKLQLGPNDHVLEIGTGWGGFALHAAEHYGCRVTTTTISGEQFEFARQRVQAAGLAERVTVLKQDYRELTGCFDKLVSIEMIEAVGYQYFDTYFQTCSRLLKDNGMMLLQAITISDQEYERTKRTVDFIQKYIFPGGCLPSVHSLCTTLAKATDLRLYHLEDIGPHYATTLRRWQERFFANLDQVRKQEFSESFIRMWEFYLCYCEGGFIERALGTVQILLTKPLCRREPIVPTLT